MKGIQKYIWLFVFLSVVAATFPLLRDLYLARRFGASELPVTVAENWELLSVFIIAIPNLAAALWLRHIAAKSNVGGWVWGTFGLVSGLLAVALFYLVRINESHET